MNAIELLDGRVYHGIKGFEKHLIAEIGSCKAVWGNLYYGNKIESPVFWNQNIWLNPFIVQFTSISEAANILRGMQRNWSQEFFTEFRRGALIQAKLPPISSKPKTFPWLFPESKMGAWSLIDANTMIASSECSSPFPSGVIEFEEDKLGPPSRAYLKLWEALVRARVFPKAGDRCLDLGASPGGWSWALAKLGANVIAVDRSPLEIDMPGITFIKHDAFTLKPSDIGNIDWLFCDVVCYPPKLYEYITKWLDSGLCDNFMCTIKMQGEPDMEAVRCFASIPNSKVVHLYHNKHELTWSRQRV